MENLEQNIIGDNLLLNREIAKKAKDDFELFFNTIFKVSCKIIEGSFTEGKWLDRFCKRLQKKDKSSTMAARKHGKTTVLMAFCMWLIYRADRNVATVQEYLYIMYSDELAGEKIKRIKQYIQVNPFFENIKDLKNTAESIIEYLINGKIVSIKPAGVFTFKRGKHPDGVLCDDILRDPQKKLDYSQIQKITTAFENEITSLPKEGGFLHLVGTSQDSSDIFWKLKLLPAWDWEMNPAILDRKKKEILFPEMFTFERLMDIELNETGKKGFRREYQLEPVRSVEGFFSKEEYQECVDKQLKNFSVLRDDKEKGEIDFDECVAGADLGKKRHPTHLSVFQPIEEREIDPKTKKEIIILYLVQVCSLWLDRMDYTDQVEIFKKAVDKFRISSFYYDNTRAELEGFEEQGELPDVMKGISMSGGMNNQIATGFEKFVNKKRIILLSDDRQERQTLSVDNTLQAPETEEGHGDSFFSIGLAIKAYNDMGGDYIQ